MNFPKPPQRWALSGTVLCSFFFFFKCTRQILFRKSITWLTFSGENWEQRRVVEAKEKCYLSFGLRQSVREIQNKIHFMASPSHLPSHLPSSLFSYGTAKVINVISRVFSHCSDIFGSQRPLLSFSSLSEIWQPASFLNTNKVLTKLFLHLAPQH